MVLTSPPFKRKLLPQVIMAVIGYGSRSSIAFQIKGCTAKKLWAVTGKGVP